MKLQQIKRFIIKEFPKTKSLEVLTDVISYLGKYRKPQRLKKIYENIIGLQTKKFNQASAWLEGYESILEKSGTSGKRFWKLKDTVKEVIDRIPMVKINNPKRSVSTGSIDKLIRTQLSLTPVVNTLDDDTVKAGTTFLLGVMGKKLSTKDIEVIKGVVEGLQKVIETSL